MKNTSKLLRIIALAVVLVFGMAVTGCDPGSGGTAPYVPVTVTPYVPVTVTFNNYYPAVNEAIVAQVEPYVGTEELDTLGIPSWKWYKTKEQSFNVNRPLVGSGNTYTVTTADKDFWIWAQLSYSGIEATTKEMTKSTVIGQPASAQVFISIDEASYEKLSDDLSGLFYSFTVLVTLTLSDGKWKDNAVITIDAIEYYIQLSGLPSGYYHPDYPPLRLSAPVGRKYIYRLKGMTSSITGLSTCTATLNTTLVSTSMRGYTNVGTLGLTAGTPSSDMVFWKEVTEKS